MIFTIITPSGTDARRKSISLRVCCRLALVLAFGLSVGCTKNAENVQPKSDRAAAEMDDAQQVSSDGVQYDKEGRRISKGFRRGPPPRPEPLRPGQREKMQALNAQQDAGILAADVLQRLGIKKLPSQKDPALAVDIVVDEKLFGAIKHSELGSTVLVRDILKKKLKNFDEVTRVLAVGEEVVQEISVEDLDGYAIRRNQRGNIKLERVSKDAREKKHARMTKKRGGYTLREKGGPSKGQIKAQELRDLIMLEVMTTPKGTKGKPIQGLEATESSNTNSP